MKASLNSCQEDVGTIDAMFIPKQTIAKYWECQKDTSVILKAYDRIPREDT